MRRSVPVLLFILSFLVAPALVLGKEERRGRPAKPVAARGELWGQRLPLTDFRPRGGQDVDPAQFARWMDRQFGAIRVGSRFEHNDTQQVLFHIAQHFTRSPRLLSLLARGALGDLESIMTHQPYDHPRLGFKKIILTHAGNELRVHVRDREVGIEDFHNHRPSLAYVIMSGTAVTQQAVEVDGSQGVPAGLRFETHKYEFGGETEGKMGTRMVTRPIGPRTLEVIHHDLRPAGSISVMNPLAVHRVTGDIAGGGGEREISLVVLGRHKQPFSNVYTAAPLGGKGPLPPRYLSTDEVKDLLEEVADKVRH